jgi:alcohol oxidase
MRRCGPVCCQLFSLMCYDTDRHRLANLDRNLKVLLIEAGESNLNNPWVFRPGVYPKNMKLDSKTASFYESRPSPWLAGRKAVVPCAHILGGGSSINFLVSMSLLF